MLRSAAPAARSALRSARPSPPALNPLRNATLGKRFASTSPANARRTWKSSALRWGIAVAGIYYYNTSPVFAEQPQHNLLNPNLDAIDDESTHSTIEALTSSRARQAERNASVLHSAADAVSSENASTSAAVDHDGPDNTGVAGLEEEAASEGAFNPETGEINWDCACLGGMAHGPCGPEFREAFSCFVYSDEEPKGMDCIDKFQNMQQCFQKYPEIYKGELEDDEELSAGLEEERQELVNEIAERKKQQSDSGSQRRLLEEPDPVPRHQEQKTSQPETPSGQEAGQAASSQSLSEEAKIKFSDDASHDEQTSASELEIFPKAAHDATSSSSGH